MITRYAVIVITFCLIGCASLPALRQPEVISKSSSTQVGFEWLRTGDIGGLVLVELEQPTLRGWWIVDTGAGVNVVSESVLPSLAGEVSETRSVQSATGEQKVRTVLLPEFKIGDWSFRNQIAAALDLSHYRKKSGVDIQGIIGMPVFSSSVLSIDGPAQTLRLSKVHGPTPPRSNPIDFHLHNGVPVIDMEADGKVLPSVILDTGNAGGLVLFSRFSKQVGLSRQKNNYIRYQASETGGQVSAYLARARKAGIGGWQMSNLSTAILSEHETSKGQALDAYSGSLGMAVFEHTSMTFDFPAKKMYLASKTSEESLGGGWGMILSGSGLVIESVLPQSPAAEAGLQPGDEITRLDGESLDLNVAQFWAKTRSKQLLELTLTTSKGKRVVQLQRSHFLPPLTW